MTKPDVDPEFRAQLDARLGRTEVLARATPALMVAYKLGKVKDRDCKGVGPLLPRAEKHGDQRALKELERFSGTKPCGFFGRSKCPRCRDNREEIERAVAAIRERQPG
jgi:hypothetical protein